MAEHSGTPVVDNSPSVASFVGEMFGDYDDAEPESDAGTPPAGTPETPASSEGTETLEPAGDTPASADATTVPDTTSPTVEADPLEGSRPADYIVNGEQRTFDGITLLKDGGGIIDPEAVPKLVRILGERDHLYETSQQQHQRLTALEKATEWQQGDTVLTGTPALEAQRVYMAQASETIKELAAILTPATFARYVSIGQNPDGSYFVQPDAAALDTLRERLQFVTDRAGFQARQAFAKIAQPVAPSPVTADAPVESFAQGTVDGLVKSMNLTLSDDSKAFLVGEFPRYVRATTAAEKPQYGARIVDQAFLRLVQREARTATTTAKIAESASAAAKANAAKLAAASVGRTGKQPARLTPAKDPEPSRADDFDTLWDKQQSAAAGALRAHR